MDDNAAWHVLILEEEGGRQVRRRVLSQSVRIDGGYEQARRSALKAARDYRPDHPMNERSRDIYQTGTDSWLVNVEGSTTWYYFNVQIARLIEDSAD